MIRFTLQLAIRELPDPDPGVTGHLLLRSKMDEFEKGFTLTPEAGDQIVARMTPRLPMPITKELHAPPGVSFPPQVVGKLISVHKHDSGSAGAWELYGVIEWNEDYDYKVDGVPCISLMLESPQGGPQILEVATTTAPLIEGLKEIKL